MAIQFQCESKSFAAAFARTKVILAKQEKQLCGYEQETGSSVYEQMEAVYKALSEFKSGMKSAQANQTSQVSYLSAAEREKLFSDEERILLAASLESSEIHACPRGMDFAVYCCALLLKAKLHPVMIFSEDRVAVGVWIYADYNMGEARISGSEFAEEAYDAGGMLLPLDCAYLMENAAFSEAVAAGCQVVNDFVFADDIVLENEDLNEPAIILADSEGNLDVLPDFEDDGTCSYFQELLFLYDQAANMDPAAASILGDAVRHQQWASAFFGEFDLPETVKGLEKLDMSQAAMDSLVTDRLGTGSGSAEPNLVEAMEQTPLLLIKMEDELGAENELREEDELKTEDEWQESVAEDIVYQGLMQEKKTLILSSRERLNKIENLFSQEKLSASMLNLDKITSSSELYTILENRCQEKEKPKDKRIEAKKRRWGEIAEKLENYNKVLGEPTDCGKTLGELLDGWEAVKNYEIDIAISPDRKWNAEILELIRSYVDAQEKCYQRDKDGDVYLNFAALTPPQKDKLVQLLHACEKPAGALYEAVEKFGQKIGRKRGQDETARSYLQAITGCAELLEGCLSLLELLKMPEYIPEPQEGDKEERKAYDDYIKRQHNLKILSQYINISELRSMDEEEREQLFAACSEVQNERNNYSLIKSRAYKVALKKIREILEQLLKPEVDPGHLDSKNWNSICEGILEYSTYNSIEEKPAGAEAAREQIFQEMTDLLGSYVHSSSYLFTYQRMLVQNLLEMEEAEMIPLSLVKKLAECILSASKQMEPGHERKRLYEDARRLISYSDSYSEALKEVFRFLKLDYHTFLKSYENESMMSFVMTWEQLLEDEKVYDEFHKVKTNLLRSQLGSVLEQFAEKNLTPEMMVQAFEKAWYHHNLAFYVEEKHFDLQDYSMNLVSFDKIEEQLHRNDEIQLENRLLRNVWKACEEFPEEMNALRTEFPGEMNALRTEFPGEMNALRMELPYESEFVYLEQAPHLLQQAFPVMLMTPEKARILESAPEIFFDRIIICGAEEIPFYQVLYPVTRGKSLIIITNQAQKMQTGTCSSTEGIESVAERAQRMGFPNIKLKLIETDWEK